jgi:hypothetical protein
VWAREGLTLRWSHSKTGSVIFLDSLKAQPPSVPNGRKELSWLRLKMDPSGIFDIECSSSQNGNQRKGRTVPEDQSNQSVCQTKGRITNRMTDGRKSGESAAKERAATVRM